MLFNYASSVVVTEIISLALSTLEMGIRYEDLAYIGHMIRMISEGIRGTRNMHHQLMFIVRQSQGSEGLNWMNGRGIIIHDHGVMQGSRCTVVPDHFPLERIYDTGVKFSSNSFDTED